MRGSMRCRKCLLSVLARVYKVCSLGHFPLDVPPAHGHAPRGLATVPPAHGHAPRGLATVPPAHGHAPRDLATVPPAHRHAPRGLVTVAAHYVVIVVNANPLTAKFEIQQIHFNITPHRRTSLARRVTQQHILHCAVVAWHMRDKISML